MNQDNRNFFLFAIIAALILFGFPFLRDRFFPPANAPATRIEGGKTQPLPNPGVQPTATTPAAARDRGQVLRESAGQRVAIQTPTLKGSISLVGPRIDDLVLTRYKETIAANSAPIRLLSPAGAADANFAEFGWHGDGLKLPDANTVWKASAPLLAPGKPLVLTADNNAGQQFRIEIAVDDQYMFTIRQSVANAGPTPVQGAAYGLIARTGGSKDASSRTIHTGPMSSHSGTKGDYGTDYADLENKGPQRFDTTGGWLGFTDKYWLTALVPDQSAAFTGEFRSAGAAQHYQADFTSAPRQIGHGQTLTQVSRFFAGAKETRLIDHYQDEEGVANFEKAIDWGWFQIVEKPIFYYLDWLFRMVGNFGVAIMLLTLTIRGLMFPIAQRQFQSMAAMRAIQPKMKAIQERYKDDKPKQQQEIMALYKSEKVNPLAGCLPTLLQIPIFYALYKVLLLTIEMRHQPFFGWIRDLSAPDPLTPLNLFGLLDFTPPPFLAIGIVPVVLGITMFFQFRLNPAPMEPAQKQIFAFMPWVLMFIMAPFAVGLQVYWITSNCLTILQQRILYARHPQLRTAPAK